MRFSAASWAYRSPLVGERSPLKWCQTTTICSGEDRNGRKKHGPDDAKDGHVGADAEGQRQNRGEWRNPVSGATGGRRSGRCAKTALIHILSGHAFFGHDSIAEAHQRIPPRLFRGHAACQVLLNPHIDVRLELGVDLAVYARTAEEIPIRRRRPNSAI